MELRPKSDPIYLSFNDIELLQPPLVASPPNSRGPSGVCAAAQHTKSQQQQQQQQRQRQDAAEQLSREIEQQTGMTAFKMQRQDSGYESYTTTPRASMSQSRPVPPSRRMSNASSTAVGSPSRPRTRPSTRRSAKSYPQATSSSPALLHHHQHQHQLPMRSHRAGPYSPSYFQFPTPDLDLVELTETSAAGRRDADSQEDQQQHQQHALPQTTHYWTSDSTRRLEYAAIDAASRGVRGWVRRHLVPDCFGPRHVAFDDDSGSVRRYRLDLDDDDNEEDEHDDYEKTHGGVKRPKTWRFWGLRKSKTV